MQWLLPPGHEDVVVVVLFDVNPLPNPEQGLEPPGHEDEQENVQAWVLQLWDSDELPVQDEPPHEGAGLLQLRLLD